MVLASKRSYSRATARRRKRKQNTLSPSVKIMGFTVAVVAVLALSQTTYLLRKHYYSSSFNNNNNHNGPMIVSHDPHDVCSLFPSTTSSSSLGLWREYADVVLRASQHSDDPEYSHRAWTQQLLQTLLSSSRLPRSLTSRPNAEGMDRLVELLEERLQVYRRIREQNNNNNHQNQNNHSDTTSTNTLSTPNNNNNNNMPSPIKIAVVGGAMSEGVGCTTTTEDYTTPHIPKGSIMTNPLYCAWPYRLETLLNRLAGFDLVQIVNMAEGGTETALMTPLLRNGITPPSLRAHGGGVDVVVNAYDSRDYYHHHPNDDTTTTTTTTTTTNLQKTNTEMTAFVRALSSSSSEPSSLSTDQDCQDDHHHHKSPVIIHLYDTTQLVPVMKREGILSVHYGDVLSTSASSSFGMAQHVSLVWVLAYGLTDVFRQYCQEKTTTASRFSFGRRTKKSQANNNTPSKCNTSSSSTSTTKCPLAWFAGPAGTVFRPREISAYLRPHTVNNDDGPPQWEAQTDMEAGFSRKAGLVATGGLGSTLTLAMPQLTQPVRYVNLMVVRHRRSNTGKWQGGVVQITLTVSSPTGTEQQNQKKKEKTQELSFQVEGSHDRDEVITMPIELDLKDYTAPIGSTLRFRMELIRGNSFKIIGMLFCP